MGGLQFTAVHVRAFLGMSRTDLHRWLTQLPPFNQAATRPRTARRFTVHDLVFFSLVAHVHRQLALPLATIAKFSSALHENISRSSSLGTPAARVFLNEAPEGTWLVDSEAKGTLSLSVDPERIWSAVYEFIGLALPAQRELAFGLVTVPTSPSEEHIRGRRSR